MSKLVWLIPAFLAVLLKVSFYTLQKSYLNTEDYTSLELSYISVFYGLLATAPVAIWQLYNGYIDISLNLMLVLVLIGGIELIGLLTYLKALENTELSIASPIKKMKTVFIPYVEVLLLGVIIEPILFVAAGLAGVGGLLVLLNDGLKSILKNLTSKGVQLAFAATLIYSILSVTSRFGTTEASPFIFGFVIFTTMTLGYRGLFRFYSDQEAPKFKNHFQKSYIPIGATGAGRSVTVWIAYSLASATTVGTFTQLTVLLTVVSGGKLLDESNMKIKLVGASLILCSSIIVILFGG